jgi:segregation and condensation protein B
VVPRAPGADPPRRGQRGLGGRAGALRRRRRRLSLAGALEALLFVSDAPATPEALAAALQAPLYAVEEALDELGERLAGAGGIQLVRIAGGYQLSTKPQHAEAVARFIHPQRQRLSRSLMEVLAIVAYEQPVTIAEIDAIRGVQSDYGLRQLLERRLVREVGRRPTPGRPVLYGTTQQFLHQFNMEALAQLPPLAIQRAPGEGA